MVYTSKDVLEQYNKGYTIVLFTCKDTIKEILNTGLYRHNRVTHGRILQ